MWSDQAERSSWVDVVAPQDEQVSSICVVVMRRNMRLLDVAKEIGEGGGSWHTISRPGQECCAQVSLRPKSRCPSLVTSQVSLIASQVPGIPIFGIPSRWRPRGIRGVGGWEKENPGELKVQGR